MSSPSSTPTQTKRIGQYVYLKPSQLAAYKECHAAVWPEVLQQIRASGISNYSIFFDPQHSILFASFTWTGTDWEKDMADMKANEKVREWWRLTDEMQVSPDGEGSSEEGGWWREVEEVFYLA